MIPLPPAEAARLRTLAHTSHDVIATHQQPDGAYPASPTFSAYTGYAWLRDGSLTAEGMSRYGDVDSVDRFHDWFDGVLAARRPQVDGLLARAAAGEEIPLADMLPTRFTFTGDDGSDPWWDFQTDGYGMWLWSVVTHADRHGIDPARWERGLGVALDVLLTFWHLPCYDWWEEHVEERHVSTLAAIVGGLEAVAGSTLFTPEKRAEGRRVADAARALCLDHGLRTDENGTHLTKWFGSDAVDGSLPSAVVPFGLVTPDDPVARATLAAVQRDLDADGGVHRFRADVFYGGGQWPLLSCLLGWNLAAAGDHAGALRHLRWVADHALTSGELPEQVDDHLLHPDHQQEWVDRWGPVATPLLWSHGMYLILADELGLLGETS